ncbi:MAG: hypothetical protein P1Q69_12400, partial [Candidatus Thorarchaeota archaeon]|nr:hypothetical protein [Candidatus Thorarchaeota archaeon]
MRKGLLFALILAFILMVPMMPSAPSENQTVNQETMIDTISDDFLIASAGGSGSQFTSTQFMSRVVDGNTLTIENSYVNTDHHNGTLDLSGYLIPGLTLYRVDMVFDHITAITEREVVGVQDQTQNFYIRELGGVSNITQLAQGFYDQPHDGLLQNYSVLYSTPIYGSGIYGDAYFVIRSDYSSASSNVTEPQALTDVGSTDTWATITSNANLTGNTVYYTLIDGNSLNKNGIFFPIIVWNSESSSGTLPTRWYQREGTTWNPIQPYEALLNYTYIPWNQTSNKAYSYTQSQDVILRGNASSLTGNSCSFTSSNNITALAFDSNQSILISHNLTLWYKKTVNMGSIWDVQVSGNDIIWNLTATLSYPSFSVDKFLNITTMPDWSAEDLYNGTSGTGEGTFTSYTGLVVCYDMTNGTWTMRFYGTNYLSAMDISNNAGGAPLPTKASILTDLDIDSTVEDFSSNPATTGSTNFTVLNATHTVWSNLQAVSAGSSTHLWDIDATTSRNGTYTLDLFWTNGTEAGYLSKQYVVFYPTTLTAESTTIDAYANDASGFTIRVNFNETYTPKYIDDTHAGVLVQYSFDGGAWTPLSYETGGNWSASIATTGYDYSAYQVRVNASGTAIQNQTLLIDVNLIYETNPLVVAWSAPHLDNISYLEQTNLTVEYNFHNGTIVPYASLNVEVNGDVWNMHYDPVGETYWLQFNGTDALPVYGTHSMNITATKMGHEFQFDDTESIQITLEPTSSAIYWSNTDTITFVEKTNLTLFYRFESGSPITGAKVNFTINSITRDFHYDSDLGYYWYEFNGTFPGVDNSYTITTEAWKLGHQGRTNSTSLTVNLEPTSGGILWTVETITWTDTIILRLNYTDSSFALIQAANQAYIYINGTERNLSGGGNGTYWYIFDNLWGLGYFEMWANISNTGYEPWEPSGITLNIVEEPTSWVITWEPSNVTLPYTYALNLTVDYTFGGGDVPNSANVNVTINSLPYILEWTGSDWDVTIPGDQLGIGECTAIIQADLHGYQSQSNVTSNVNITLAAISFVVAPNSDTTITYAEQIEITVTYTDEFAPITDATVRIIVNDNTILIPIYSAFDEMWHYTLAGVSADLGVWNITVVANRTGYDTGVDQFNLTVMVDNPVITSSWNTLSAEYAYDIPLSVNLTASTSAFLIDAVVTIEINETSRIVTNHNNGTYTTFFDSMMELGVYTVNFTMYKYGYINSTVILTLTVIETQTVLAVTVSEYNPYYDETSVITISYHLLNTTLITPSNITIELDGVNQTLEWNVDHWEITYIAANLGLGQYDIEINASAYGFAMKTQSFIVEVLPIPTVLDIVGLDTMYVNDTLLLLLTYNDTRTDTPMALDSLTIGWDGMYLLTAASGGSYNLLLNTSALHEGVYNLDLQISELGYALTSDSYDITVRKVTTALITSLNLQVYQNETILIVASFNDTYHNNWIHWANLTLGLNDQNYTMEYDILNEQYYVEIWMDYEVFTVRNHFATIYADAVDCVSDATSVIITVVAKTQYVLTIDTDPVVSTGTQLGVHVTVLNDGVAAGAVSVIVHAILTINGTPTEAVATVRTNDEGLATASIDIPEGTTLVEVWAEIEGTGQVWHVSTATVAVTAQPPSDFFSLFIAFVLSTTGIFLLMISLIVIGIVAGYTRKVKPGRLAARNALNKQLDDFNDLDSVQHFMAVYVNRGTCVFYHPFKKGRIQADLISGFISAVTSVYGEIKGDGVQGTLEEIHYQGLRLNSYSGRYVLGILIMEKEMTPALRNRLQFFIEMFENEYESHLSEWTGIVDCFDPEWIVSNLVATFGYDWIVPHAIDETVKMNGLEKKIIGYIKASLGDKEERDFLIGDYIQPIAQMIKKPSAEVLDIFLKMEDKELIHPISIQTILLRQGLGLSGVDDLIEDIDKIESPEEEIIDEERDKEEESVEIGEEVNEEPPEEKEKPDPR